MRWESQIPAPVIKTRQQISYLQRQKQLPGERGINTVHESTEGATKMTVVFDITFNRNSRGKEEEEKGKKEKCREERTEGREDQMAGDNKGFRKLICIQAKMLFVSSVTQD